MTNQPTPSELMPVVERVSALIEHQPDDMLAVLYESNETGVMRTTGITVAEIRTLINAARSTMGDDAVERVNVKWFSQELRELFRRHFVAWGDSTDWEKIATKALESRSLRAALSALKGQQEGTRHENR